MLQVSFQPAHYAAFKAAVAALARLDKPPCVLWADAGGGFPAVRAVFAGLQVVVAIAPQISGGVLLKDFPAALQVDQIG